jgi:hypothetical protein
MKVRSGRKAFQARNIMIAWCGAPVREWDGHSGHVSVFPRCGGIEWVGRLFQSLGDG